MNCKYFRELLTLVVVLSPLLLMPVHAVQAAEKAESSTPEKPATSTDKTGKQEQVHKTKRIIYKPPSRGAPAARVGAGTRGVEGAGPELRVLTPDHTGYSSSPQPTLYWYLSKTMSARFEVALINDLDIQPILETTLDREIKAGINQLNLADYDVSLKPGVVYQWSIALVTDPGQRSSDSIASGRVKYAPLSETQKNALDASSADEAMWFFANAGYWYDLYDRLSGLISKQPNDKNLLDQRTVLLKQVGLQEVTER